MGLLFQTQGVRRLLRAPPRWRRNRSFCAKTRDWTSTRWSSGTDQARASVCASAGEATPLPSPSVLTPPASSSVEWVPSSAFFSSPLYLSLSFLQNIRLKCLSLISTFFHLKQGFSSFESANNLISMFVFFFNFVRPHSALNGLTPAQVAGLNLSKRRKREFLLVAWSFSMISWVIFSF